jgi:heme ABC exporter ATP-binding subunit CcmA
MIRIEGLTVAFGRTLAVHDMDLTLEPGIHGLFGPNGSGKTTLLRVLSGLLRPTHGRVLLDGRGVSASDEDFRRMVGYAGHDTGLYRHLTVGENLNLFARLYGVSPRRIDDLLERLDITHRLDVRAADLSAGQKRRAAVARALLHEPGLLLLDEPYANLDDDGAARVSDTVKSWRAGGRCAVIATHGAKRLKPFVDATVVLRRGELVAHRRTEPVVQT